MGWPKLFEKKKDRKNGDSKAGSGPELDLAALPDFTGKRMKLRLS